MRKRKGEEEERSRGGKGRRGPEEENRRGR